MRSEGELLTQKLNFEAGGWLTLLRLNPQKLNTVNTTLNRIVSRETHVKSYIHTRMFHMKQ